MKLSLTKKIGVLFILESILLVLMELYYNFNNPAIWLLATINLFFGVALLKGLGTEMEKST